MKLFITVFLLFLVINTHAEDKNVIIKYKQYESFDLGNLEIKGSLIAPGDISVKERTRKVFERDLFVREEFSDLIREDIKSLR